MSTTLTQRELRHRSGEVMRGLERGETYIITSNGRPIGELRPLPQPSLTAVAWSKLPPESGYPGGVRQLRDELDAVADTDPFRRPGE